MIIICTTKYFRQSEIEAFSFLKGLLGGSGGRSCRKCLAIAEPGGRPWLRRGKAASWIRGRSAKLAPLILPFPFALPIAEVQTSKKSGACAGWTALGLEIKHLHNTYPDDPLTTPRPRPFLQPWLSSGCDTPHNQGPDDHILHPLREMKS